MIEDNNKNPKQNNYSPIILWLFPLFLLNIGWRFFVSIDRRWEEQERIEIANKETEALAAKSDFSYCFATISAKFCEVFKSDTELFGEASQEGALSTYIKSRSDNIFKSPFPKHNIVVFRASKEKARTRIIYSNDETLTNKSFLADTFEYLVKVNSKDSTYTEEERKKGEEISKQLFGNIIHPSIFAESQRSKSSLAYLNNKSCSFIWDYFKDENTSDTFGFFIFIDNTLDLNTAGRQLAIDELKDRQKDSNTPNYGAFIPLFPNSGEIVASEELKKLPDFSLIIEKWTPQTIKDIYNWQKNGAPDKTCRIANYQAFFYIAPNQTHSAVLFVPVIGTIKMPVGLLIFDSISITIILGLLFRGFIFGKWPIISLKVRFITTYFLAACLPLGLMIIASYGYISEYKHTDIFNNQSRLKLCISKFDNAKIQTQEEYKTTFLEIQNNQSIYNAFNRLEKSSENYSNKITPESMEVISKILNQLNKSEHNLPIVSLSIIDEYGRSISNFGNELNPTYNLLQNNNAFLENNDNKLIDSSLSEHQIIHISLLNSLRKKINDISTSTNKLDIIPFSTPEGNNLKETIIPEIENNNINSIITKIYDNKSYSFIYNYIYINGVPRFVICLYWDESSLDEKTFNSVFRYYTINEPYFIFTAYKANSNGIKIWPENKDRHRTDFENTSINLIKQAYFRNSSVSSRDKNKSIVAVPSKIYKDVIFAGGVFYHDLEMDIFKRFWICIIVIFIALVIFLSCLHYSSIIFIQPIRKLKGLLDKISEGNFDIKIKTNSKDEFSLVCNEFNQMTKELSIRKELSTLLSDHAVEALSKKESDDEITNVESFKGTVLVSDIRNFTGMCEEYSPNLITELLDKHFAVMTKIISSNGGRIYKYVGDAIEAIFADRDNLEKSSTERAYLSACEMLKSLKELNEERSKNNQFNYKIGIGLCYGDMYAGTIGSLETRLDYAIIGDSLKEAAKLESISRKIPDFPLVVDKYFVDAFNSVNPKIKFVPIDNNNQDAYCFTDKDAATKLLEKYNNANEVVSPDISLSSDNQNQETNKNTEIIDVEEYFSFKRKFIPGSIFVIILAIIMASGIYFVYTTAHNSEKIPLSVANNRTLEQMLCKEYGKTAFDIKCREICTKLQTFIEKTNTNDATEDYITNRLNKIFDSDNSLKGIDINRLFIKVDSWTDLSTKDNSFADKISLKPIANSGYSENETKTICNIFKHNISVDCLEKLYNNSVIEEKDSFYQSCKNYINNNYKDNSEEIFGAGINASVLKDNANNASIDISYSGKPFYLFWFDFYKENKDKPFGYLIISMSSKQVMESIPLLLSSYSKNEALVILKNRENQKWYFSDNVPEDIQKGILLADKKQSIIDEKNIKYIGNEFLYNLLGVTNKGIKEIGGIYYDLYLTRLCKLNKGNPRNALFWVFVIVLGTSITLWNISKGTSRINTSIAAKLWVTLLIVAVIPVITVFFVFGLFRSEYYSVKCSVQRAEMQRFEELFEQKHQFSSPLIWNYIKTKNKSEQLQKCINYLDDNPSSDSLSNKDSSNNMKDLFNNWVKESKSLLKEEINLSNFSIENIFIASEKGWEISLDDENKFNSLLNELSYQILKNEENDSKVIKYQKASSEKEIIKLSDIKNIFGNDKYISFIHDTNKPVYLQFKEALYGFYHSTLQANDNSNIIIWVVKFNDYNYLTRLLKDINSENIINIAERNKYGEIFKNNNDYWRLSLSGYANWISTSDIPISDFFKFENREWYFVDGRLFLNGQKAIILLITPESIVLNEIIYLSIAFYILLGISLLIIIHNTRNIADDIINPINSLMMGIKEVNKENFSYRINSDRTDELGALCSSFDKMIKGLDEKRLMSHMISKTANLVTSKEGNISVGKSQFILLYVGIPMFSPHQNGNKNNEIITSLSVQTSKIAGIIMNEGGEVDKIIGDRILAVFPVKDDTENAAQAAYNAAKNILNMDKENQIPFPVAIGINFGEVINGFLGIGNKRDFTVIGDAVNVTARIESLAESLEKPRCLISNSYFDIIRNSVKAEEYGEVELKGKSQPMKVYRLL